MEVVTASLDQASARPGDRPSTVDEGRLADLGPELGRSWLRCLADHGLEPMLTPAAPALGPVELALRRQRQADLIDCSRHEVTALVRALGDPDAAVVLADHDGVVLENFRVDGSLPAASRDGFVAGTRWDEASAGTNAIGTCLAEGQGMSIEGDEHFLACHRSLVCSAAPLIDDRGRIQAVLAVCAGGSESRQPPLALLRLSCRNIGNRLFDLRHRDAHTVRFQSRPELVCTASEGKLAVDADGIILASNCEAPALLGLDDGRALIGRRLDELFMTGLDQILERCARQSFHPTPVYRSRSAHRLFLVAQPPARLPARLPARPSVRSPARSPASVQARRGPAARPDRSPAPLADAPPALDALSHGDPVMARQIGRALRVIARDIPVLIQGETGTGKDVFARALHASSPAAAGPFVAINCASLPDALVESELFGYRAGAFTGAQREGRRGKILEADGGTLFLDEIGDMPLALQARLLRVLEDRRVTPLGSEAAVRVDIQLISASHRQLAALVADGRFREDLYYRLSGVELELPPLRRRSDRRELIAAILAEECRGYREPPALSTEVEALLMNHPWPGNLRQLRHVLRTACALCDGDWLAPADLPEALVASPAAATAPTAPDTPAAQVVPTARSGQAEPGTPAADQAALPLRALTPLQLSEKQAIVGLLAEHRWNLSQVARVLQVSRNTVYRKLRHLGIPMASVLKPAAPVEGHHDGD